MVSQSEKRLSWHPRHDNRFAVGGGSQITLYEWLPESSEIKQVTAQTDLPLMKCFAWSPDPLIDDLVAVGTSSGKVDLMRLEATKSSRDQVLSSGPTVTLPVRNSRPCNALAFSDVEPNYLAVGLDKVRDPSLCIWDIHAARSHLLQHPTDPTVQVTAPVNLPRSSSQIHIPRGEIPPRTDQRILQVYAPAESVSSIAFLPSSPTSLVSALSHRWLRLFDLRNPSSNHLSVAAKVHGIATDPFVPHRLGCFDDGVATIWDARRLTQPLLTFTEKDAGADGARVRAGAAITKMEFSNTRRGVLAILEKDASYVRFWDLQQSEIVEVTSSERTRSRDSSQSGKATRSWADSILPWSGTSVNSSQSHVPAPGETVVPYNLVLSDTRKTKNFTAQLASFALVPSAETHPLTSNIMVVDKNGDLELYAVHDAPKSTPWSARGELAVALGPSYRIFPGFHEEEPPRQPWEIPMLQSLPGSKAHSLDRRHSREASVARGRSARSERSPAPLFGRGDEDGFPALPARSLANLSASRPGRSRTFSPAALRNLQFEHSAMPKRGNPKSSVIQNNRRNLDALSLNGGHQKHRRLHSRHRRETSAVKATSTDQSLQHLVEADISMTMRRRVVHGYGLMNPLHNALVVSRMSTDDYPLAEFWRWIDHSQRVLSDPSSRIDGYNFACQGILGIWEGFQSIMPNTPIQALSPLPVDLTSMQPSRRSSRRRAYATGASDDFLTALNEINERNGIDPGSWKPAGTTARLSQRQLALKLCGWSLAENDLKNALKRWEKEHRYSQAACWLVFTDQPKRGVELLMRSNDESLHMMSGMLAALAPSNGTSPRNHELVEHCERLIIRMQDPYLRAMLTYLTAGDWSEVLQEEALPLRERLAIAFQFLDDKDLSSYLRRVTDRFSHDGDIEGLIVTGITASGMDVLQAYVDSTGDVQTAAIVSSLSPTLTHDLRHQRWLDAYRDLLDGWKLFHHRCQLDIDRGVLLQDAVQSAEMVPFEWAPRQILLRCNYCNKPMDQPYAENTALRPTACPHCGRPLPRCVVCLMTLNIVQDSTRTSTTVSSHTEDTIDEALVFCQTCRHGGHASHILQWFYGEDGRRSHGTCPVAGCECRCADEFC
ncbi:hypothetical protein IEO21_07417 [Rhodonia placenta]|uniref:Uncharacterized protein n=1 Tax=Rhodonia placenta TaxID=104341 RepID=A0A8H7NY22_9APHY|nr:hypothetical protein IEO21_07417 [Postia placenta]